MPGLKPQAASRFPRSLTKVGKDKAENLLYQRHCLDPNKENFPTSLFQYQLRLS